VAKIGVITTDGVNIDGHFGQAKRIHIYEVEDHAYTFSEIRRLPGSQGETAHSAAHGALAVLADVDTVLAKNIGPGSIAVLNEAGIRAFAMAGSIEKALSVYGKRLKLIERLNLGGGGCSSCSGGCGQS
jgi:nitrogen fixation protein NifB